MNDFELERYCNAHPDCDCMCMKCAAFYANYRYNNV